MVALPPSLRSFYWASICRHLSISFPFFSSSTFHLQHVPDVTCALILKAFEVPLCCAFCPLSSFPESRLLPLSYRWGCSVHARPQGWHCTVPTFLSAAFCFQTSFPLLPFLSALALPFLHISEHRRGKLHLSTSFNTWAFSYKLSRFSILTLTLRKLGYWLIKDWDILSSKYVWGIVLRQEIYQGQNKSSTWLKNKCKQASNISYKGYQFIQILLV